MSRARSASTGRTYGLARVLKAWGLPRSTFYERRRRPLCPRPPARRGPKTRYSDDDLLVEIRRTIQESPFHGEGHRKVWARRRRYSGAGTINFATCCCGCRASSRRRRRPSCGRRGR